MKFTKNRYESAKYNWGYHTTKAWKISLAYFETTELITCMLCIIKTAKILAHKDNQWLPRIIPQRTIHTWHKWHLFFLTYTSDIKNWNSDLNWTKTKAWLTDKEDSLTHSFTHTKQDSSGCNGTQSFCKGSSHFRLQPHKRCFPCKPQIQTECIKICILSSLC